MTQILIPPPSFRRACGKFHINVERMCPTFEEMAAFALSGMNDLERVSLAEYLDQLLSADYSAEQLQSLWNSSGADVFVPDAGNLLAILRAMREKLRSGADAKETN